MANRNLVIRPKHFKGDDSYRTFSVRFKVETIERLDDLSSKTGHSRNHLMEMIVEQALDCCIIEEG